MLRTKPIKSILMALFSLFLWTTLAPLNDAQAQTINKRKLLDRYYKYTNKNRADQKPTQQKRYFNYNATDLTQTHNQQMKKYRIEKSREIQNSNSANYNHSNLNQAFQRSAELSQKAYRKRSSR